MKRLAFLFSIAGFALAGPPAASSIVAEARSWIARNDFARAEARVREYRAANGVTPEGLEALSWLGRGALAQKQLEKAGRFAAEAHQLALDLLKGRSLDTEPHLPIALGAAIEVQAQLMARRGELSAAVDFLRGELETYRATSIRTRIQKNIHLLSLEGKPAPPLDVRRWLGAKAAPLDTMKGRPVLLFFWAHWCPDCKGMAPALARLKADYGNAGLTIYLPTQCYGYAARGAEATPEEEVRYIDQVRRQFYAAVADAPAPVSEENLKNYGSSTTPTLVLIDRQGIVRLYHPGRMSYEELAPIVALVSR